MYVLWGAVAVLLVIGLIKTSVKILKFVFTLCLIGAAVFLVSSLGGVLW